MTTHAPLRASPAPPRSLSRLLACCISALAFALPACAAETPGLPDAIRAEVLDPASLPGGTYSETKAWELEGPLAGHQIGRAVSDPDASGGKAWEARLEKDRADQELFYGPYLDIEPGDYVAFFRIRLLEDSGEDIVAHLDAASSYGQIILRYLDVTGSDLAVGRYVEIPLPFHSDGGKLECRLNWSGYSALRADKIDLFRIAGAQLSFAPKRVPDPQPSGEPKNLSLAGKPVPYPEIFPRSAPPADRLWVMDLRRETPDRKLMLLTLQGIVNRTQPRIYAIFNDTDVDWLAWMKKRGWVKETRAASRPEDLIRRFRSEIKGVVVTDPRLPATVNVANMVASVKDGIVVSPRLLRSIDLPVLDDLRGRWKTSVAAYGWAFDHLWGQLSHQVIACSYPGHLGLRDYLTEQKVFIFWLPGALDGAKPYEDANASVRQMERLFAKMPANIPVMSYPWAGKDVGIGEGPGVTLFAEFAKYLVGSIDCSNLSVHSGIRIAQFRQKFPPAPKLRKDKIYVSFVISDGDNLPVLTVNNFPQFWKDSVRGKLPLGWTASPSAQMLIPDILDYYYSTATPNDEILGAVSGIGYTYPDSYAKRYRAADRKRIYDGFLDQTGAYMKRMDEKDLWIMNAAIPSIISRYAERIPSLQGLFLDYGRRVTSYSDATYPAARNVPVFHGLTNWSETDTREERIASAVRQVKSLTPSERPAFMHLFVLNWFADLPALQEIARRLGPEYVVVRPDHLAKLYGEVIAQEKAVIRAPSKIAVVEGQAIRFSADVQNASAKPMTLKMSAPKGLSGASVQPGGVRLESGRSAEIRVTGTPSGSAIQIAASGAFGKRERTLSLIRVPRSELTGPLPAKIRLQFDRRYEAEDLPHNAGGSAKDPKASGGLVWSAEAGATKAGHLVYGPYADFAKGRYLVLFRLKRTGPGFGVAATLDASPAGGIAPPLAKKDVRAQDLPLGEFRSIPLIFNHPGGPLETRVFWPGRVSIAADSVTLWKVE